MADLSNRALMHASYDFKFHNNFMTIQYDLFSFHQIKILQDMNIFVKNVINRILNIHIQRNKISYSIHIIL